MKSCCLLVLGIIFFLQTVSAQKKDDDIEYGKISKAELQMTDCSFEQGAAAMYLLNFGDVDYTLSNNNSIRSTYIFQQRIKILKTSGYEFANVRFPYLKNKQFKISSVRGAVYNLKDDNIEIEQLKSDDIFKSISASKSGESTVAFTFPNVKVGSVIEFEISINTKNIYGIPDWDFQDDIPTKLSVYKVRRQPLTQVYKKIKGGWPVTESSELDDSKGFDNRKVILGFEARDIPSFKPEPYMSNKEDYLYKVVFSAINKEDAAMANVRKYNNEWIEINKELLDYDFFGRQFNADIPNSRSFIQATKKLKTTGEKINAVLDYVKSNLKWNSYYSVFSSDLEIVWKEKEATSGEMNLSLLNLLRKCGVQCYPVLFSTRKNGKADFDFPSINQFNTVDVAAVDGNKFDVLDATDQYTSYKTPPINVVNQTGFLVDALNVTKINVDFGRALIKDSTELKAHINSDGSVQGYLTQSLFDLSRLIANEDTRNKPDGVKEINGYIVDSSEIINKDNRQLPLIMRKKFHYDLTESGDFYFLNPSVFFTLGKNPFTDTSRHTDVDFIAASEFILDLKVMLDKDIKLEEIPANANFAAVDSNLVFTCTNVVNNNSIHCVIKLDINKAEFDKIDYPELKNFFDRVYTYFNNQFLFKKDI